MYCKVYGRDAISMRYVGYTAVVWRSDNKDQRRKRCLSNVQVKMEIVPCEVLKGG